MSGEVSFEDLPFECAKLLQKGDTFLKFWWAWVQNGEEFLIGHGLDDADDHEQSESEGEPVWAIEPVDAVCEPSEEDVLHIG
ncbi:MAG: hypothetical protein RLZZ458_854 [Planctomycetota bacterium]